MHARPLLSHSVSRKVNRVEPPVSGLTTMRSSWNARQRDLGNQTIQRLAEAGVLQAKLVIGPTGDRYEREADTMAEAVMRMTDRQAPSVASGHAGERLQRMCAECEAVHSPSLQPPLCLGVSVASPSASLSTQTFGWVLACGVDCVRSPTLA